ncbi:hypothetical protein DFP72DRAFT_1042432 [Ephemerocybe angulata]|uniref:Uncharacterized protein n=1 Tax=Ephemerocybe angulata TaxID=980116 RepID=A0A8H6IBA2_9AGAR|nr:hypothetical protein DFP72DRAFT_1042432 [Tulosesus angulatus]
MRPSRMTGVGPAASNIEPSRLNPRSWLSRSRLWIRDRGRAELDVSGTVVALHIRTGRDEGAMGEDSWRIGMEREGEGAGSLEEWCKGSGLVPLSYDEIYDEGELSRLLCGIYSLANPCLLHGEDAAPALGPSGKRGGSRHGSMSCSKIADEVEWLCSVIAKMWDIRPFLRDVEVWFLNQFDNMVNLPIGNMPPGLAGARILRFKISSPV